ncbi:MAG: chemotaxis protein CheW [Planctomycetota bacterium]
MERYVVPVEVEDDPMLLITCHAGANRYAIDSRHVREVLPRVQLHRLGSAPGWLAGVLIYRGTTSPVIDLTQLVHGAECPNRFSSRIVVLHTQLGGVDRQFGLLAEHVGVREVGTELGGAGGEPAGRSAIGEVFLDEDGVFELIDITRMVSKDREEVLFPLTPQEAR